MIQKNLNYFQLTIPMESRFLPYFVILSLFCELTAQDRALNFKKLVENSFFDKEKNAAFIRIEKVKKTAMVDSMSFSFSYYFISGFSDNYVDGIKELESNYYLMFKGRKILFHTTDCNVISKISKDFNQTLKKVIPPSKQKIVNTYRNPQPNKINETFIKYFDCGLDFSIENHIKRLVFRYKDKVSDEEFDVMLNDYIEKISDPIRNSCE